MSNKKELKKILKPLIKECIKEVLFEEPGALSNVISEVVSALGGNNLVENNIQPKKESKDMVREKKLKEFLDRKKELTEQIGKDSYNGINLFEGTTPMEPEKKPSSGDKYGPMRDVNPRDPGVDLSHFSGLQDRWKRTLG